MATCARRCQFRGMVTCRSRPPTIGTLGDVPSQTGARSTMSPAVNSVTFSKLAKLHSRSRSVSPARWCMEVMPFKTRITRLPLRSELAHSPKPPSSVCPVLRPSAVPFCTAGFLFGCSILLNLKLFSEK